MEKAQVFRKSDIIALDYRKKKYLQSQKSLLWEYVSQWHHHRFLQILVSTWDSKSFKVDSQWTFPPTNRIVNQPNKKKIQMSSTNLFPRRLCTLRKHSIQRKILPSPPPSPPPRPPRENRERAERYIKVLGNIYTSGYDRVITDKRP